MIPHQFEYSRPVTLHEALALIAAGAKPLAGGMSLIPMMKLRLAAPEHVVDLSRIPGLRGITESDGTLRIGAMTTHYEVESSPLLRARCPLLAETAGHIGDVQVRNRGTIGGSVAHNDPAADYPAALLALDARVHIIGPKGKRSQAMAEFLTDTFTTTLEADELLEAVEVAAESNGAGASYQKMLQPASGFAIVGVAARAGKNGKAQVGVTGLGAKAYRATACEEALARGAAVEEAVKSVAAGVEANSDIHASAAYRARMAEVYAARAIRAALAKAT